MKILIRQARIVDPSSSHNGQVSDVFIDNGVIQSIGSFKSSIQPDKIVDIEGIHLSPGWVDVFANFADPGFEFKETLESGAAAAAAGGFTDVFILPNTQPAIHSKSTVEYIIQRSRSLPVTIHPIGAITRNAEGKELAEMYDMRASGAIAFSDGINPVQSSGLLVKALQYVKAFDGVIIQIPDDKSMNPQGLMNEGIMSTQLGLPGKAAMSEELTILRDIELSKYAESKIHFTAVSTKSSADHIRRAKGNGLQVTCSVTPYHLLLTEEDLHSYDTNLKVNPPLRTKDDRTALQNNVSDGIIDCIASHHFPHEYDSKVLEFEYAKFGMISLETAFAVFNTSMPSLAKEKLVDIFSNNARRIFGLNPAAISEGSKACITLFNPDTQWTVSEKDIRSKSKNSPFIGKVLKGRVIGIVNDDNVHLN